MKPVNSAHLFQRGTFGPRVKMDFKLVLSKDELEGI